MEFGLASYGFGLLAGVCMFQRLVGILETCIHFVIAHPGLTAQTAQVIGHSRRVV